VLLGRKLRGCLDNLFYLSTGSQWTLWVIVGSIVLAKARSGSACLSSCPSGTSGGSACHELTLRERTRYSELGVEPLSASER
jgi:hypothetical protein